MTILQGDAKEMIEDCLKRNELMTEWEQCFIKSISSVGNCFVFSNKQLNHINQIWKRVTENG